MRIPRRYGRPPGPGQPITGASRRRGGQPGVALGVLGRVIGVEVDEAPLDLPVANLEDVAPAPGAPLRHAGPPWAVLVLAVARALARHEVAAGEDPVEVRVMVRDGLDRLADVAEELADLLLAVRQPPLREVDLRVVGEKVEDAAASGREAAVVECLQVFEGDRLALLIGHGLVRQRHGTPPDSALNGFNVSLGLERGQHRAARGAAGRAPSGSAGAGTVSA